ncbi:hypothetical protein M3Y98_00884200 [Aphelenchoides besseyi]|nr:hypothetical protein M3Y98_00884200 [Aphelenchoides besseyi]KAI6193062.1 hypothetical protein M3Y96_00978400 [Aphelenchoides besseyi]
MEFQSSLQKVLGAASLIDSEDSHRPPPQKRAHKMDETAAAFHSPSIAELLFLNGAAQRNAQFLPPPPQPQPTSSDTWARLLAVGSNGTSSFSALDEAFVELFADKVANKVLTALTPQIQQIRTAIIGLTRLVELQNQQAAAEAAKRVQTPPTPARGYSVDQNAVFTSAPTATVNSATSKKRHPSPSKTEAQPLGISTSYLNAQQPGGQPLSSIVSSAATAVITAIPPSSTQPQSAATATNGDESKAPTATPKTTGQSGGTKSDKKGEGKVNAKRTVKEVPDVYRIIKLDDLNVHFNMTQKLCLLCQETFTESHLHSVKRHMYRKHRNELDDVLRRKTLDPFSFLKENENAQLISQPKYDENEIVDVVDTSEPPEPLIPDN